MGGLLFSCSKENLSERVYNKGNNLLPLPTLQQKGNGRFILSDGTRMYADTPEEKKMLLFMLISFVGLLDMHWRKRMFLEQIRLY